MGWVCGAYGRGEGVYRVLVGKPEGRRPLARPRRRWADNIRTDLQDVGCGYMDWIGLAQDRDRWRTLVSAVMNLRAPWNAGNFLTSCKPVSFSRRTLHHGVIVLRYHLVEKKRISLSLYTPLSQMWGVELYRHTFSVTELDGGEWLFSRLVCRREPPVSIELEDGWTSEPVWRFWSGV